MCIAIGVEWDCGHDWRFWFGCSQAGCQVRRIKRDGLPPTPPVPDMAGLPADEANYQKFAKDYATFLKVPWCCGPECCGHVLDESKDMHSDDYWDVAHQHLGNCFPAFEIRLGKVNSMRLDLGEGPITDRPPTISQGTMPNHMYAGLPWQSYTNYQNLFNPNAGLQFPNYAVSSIQQYFKIRAHVFENPGIVQQQWRPSQQILLVYNQLKVIRGNTSQQAAETGLNARTNQRCVALLTAIRNLETPLNLAAPTAQDPLPPASEVEMRTLLMRRPDFGDYLNFVTLIDDVKFIANSRLEQGAVGAAPQASREVRLQFLYNELHELSTGIKAVTFDREAKNELVTRWKEAKALVDLKNGIPEPAVTGAGRDDNGDGNARGDGGSKGFGTGAGMHFGGGGGSSGFSGGASFSATPFEGKGPAARGANPASRGGGNKAQGVTSINNSATLSGGNLSNRSVAPALLRQRPVPERSSTMDSSSSASSAASNNSLPRSTRRLDSLGGATVAGNPALKSRPRASGEFERTDSSSGESCTSLRSITGPTGGPGNYHGVQQPKNPRAQARKRAEGTGIAKSLDHKLCLANNADRGTKKDGGGGASKNGLVP